MVNLRVKMIGSGTPDDPFTLPLPTFLVRAVDYDAGTAIVTIPNKLLPNGVAQIGVQTIQVQGIGTVVTGVKAADQQAVITYLDNHYPDLAGFWRPQLQ